jgi:hypothetical protein
VSVHRGTSSRDRVERVSASPGPSNTMWGSSIGCWWAALSSSPGWSLQMGEPGEFPDGPPLLRMGTSPRLPTRWPYSPCEGELTTSWGGPGRSSQHWKVLLDIVFKAGSPCLFVLSWSLYYSSFKWSSCLGFLRSWHYRNTPQCPWILIIP